MPAAQVDVTLEVDTSQRVMPPAGSSRSPA